MQLGFGIAVSSLAWVYGDWIASVWMGSATFCSVIIAYNLSAFLASTYVRAQGAIDLINHFLRCLIHTGLLTSVLTVVNLLAFSFMGQYVRIGVNFPLGTLHLITILAVLNARPCDTTDHPVFDEYEFGGTRHKAGSVNAMGPVSLEGSLSLKIPAKFLRKEPPITVLVQQDTHVIGISPIRVDSRNSTLQQHEYSDGTESIETRVELPKSQTSTI
ncbi:unnamed protein product [Rhizoctonia solani]|uniref:DUF6534 domain-containing protein n=1 Tax=Rhizoctonia solani TaxID=456999 RepID=A0A8H3GTL6_9AGAM|nr:unnamed protein product [Rhizoctonia solani]